MTGRLLRAMAAVLLALSGLGLLTTSGTLAHQSADCTGIEEYIAALETTGEALEAAMPPSDSDLTTWTAEDYTAASDALTAAQTAFGEIDPPAVADEFHTLLLQQLGLFASMFDTMSTAGVFGALIYAEQLDALGSQLDAEAEAIETACSVELTDIVDNEEAVTASPVAEPVEVIEDSNSTPATGETGIGTRANPIPLGQTARIHPDWEMAVVSVTPDATDLIVTEDSFNEPPAEGHQFFLATVRLTYVGVTSDEFYVSDLSAVGQSAVGYNQYDDYCGAIPNELPSRELFTGGTIEGNVCWSIASEDADSLVLYDDYGPPEERVYLSMMPGSSGTPTAGGGFKGAVATAGAGGEPSGSTGVEPIGLSITGFPIMPIGATMQLDDAFSLTIDAVDQNDTDAVTDPAPDDYQYVNVEMTLGHLRDQTDTFDLGRLLAIGPTGALYSAVGNSCGVVDGQLSSGEYTGAMTVTGNVCFEVNARDVAGLSLYDQTQSGDSQVYLSLDPNAES